MPDSSSGSGLIGKKIGQFEVVEKIGAGGMATVFKAFQPSIARYVALKILPAQFANDPSFVQRFQREAKAIAALEHPHIVPLYDFGTQDDLTYMAMRYIKGGDLSNLMGQSVSNERIADIVGNIAKALDYAHRNDVVHRDIKPSNILIDENDEVMLTDFGIAKTDDTKLTGTGMVLGTPHYMAPEQARGQKIDGRTDIYSLGVVLYELLTGRPPFEAKTPYSIVIKHISEPIPLPRTIKPDIPEAFEQIVIKAMAKDPSQRYDTAGQMAQALQNALKKSEGTLAVPKPATMPDVSPPAVTPQAAKRSGAGPLLIGGIVVVLLLCLGGGGIVILLALTSGDDEGVAAATATLATTPVAIATAVDTPLDSDATVDANTGTETPTPPTSTPPAVENNNDTVADSIGFNSELSDGKILFEEFFNSNQNEWFTGEEEDEFGLSLAEITDGRYRLSQQATQGVTWWSNPEKELDFDDFILSLDAEPVEHNASFGYGFIFRRNSDEDFYMLKVDDKGFFISLFIDGAWQTLLDYTETSAIKSDGSNTLVVKAIGSSFTFFINGQEVATVEDNTLKSGSIGVILELYNEGEQATVDFDNLFVFKAESQEKSNDIIFAEYFDSDANGWSTGQFDNDYNQHKITIADGKYTLDVTAKQPTYVEKTPPNLEFSDFILNLEATPTDSEEHYSYGIAFRENAEGHTYAFEIGNDGLYAILLFDGEWQMLKDWSSTTAINVGQTNELIVKAQGKTMTFFVNGEQLTTIEDDTLTAGSIGLVIDMLKENQSATVNFDNLIVRLVGGDE